MNKCNIIFYIGCVLSNINFASAHSGLLPLQAQGGATVLTSLDVAKASGAVIIGSDKIENLAIAYVTEAQAQKISQLSHFQGKCGGFELLTENEIQNPAGLLKQFQSVQNYFRRYNLFPPQNIVFNSDYQNLANLADPNSLKKTIQWLSSFPSRNHNLGDPNKHVLELEKELKVLLKDAPWQFEIQRIAHSSTRQESLKLKIIGSSRPSEIVVLGGHFDSINQSFFANQKAPGADDNASGSANLFEAVRALKSWPSFERTLEFYWYAGEEGGLLGSAEIAKDSQAKARDIIGVLQLDMTLFPGSGEHVIGLVDDFTSPWLRQFLTEINQHYVKAKFINDSCGYACSDHASWHRQGFHAVTPFEATTKTMNKKIHSDQDLIDTKSNFNHSNNFTKFAILFGLELGNSSLRP